MKKFLVLLSLLTLGASFGYASGVDGSTFVSQIVPTTVVAGTAFTVTQTWQNSGSNAWVAFYRIAQSPSGSTTWTPNPGWGGRYYGFENAPGGSVAPGVTQAYSFRILAPTTPGVYSFQTQLVHDGVAWFGPTSINVSITVTNATGPALKVLDPTP